MRLILLNSLEKIVSLEKSLSEVCRAHGWRLTVVRLGSRRVVWLVACAFGALAVSLMVGSWLMLRVLRRMWWALVLLSTAALLYFLFATTTKVLMMLQMKLGLFNVKKALQTREPNLVVGAGYGCVLVLEDPLLRQLPSVMISPNVIDYATKLPQAEAKQLNLEDSPFVYVTYDTSQSPTTIKESVLLADTAEPGLSATDWLCVRFADERKLTTILEYSFSKGWTNIAEREGCRLELDPNDNLVRVLVDDDLCSKLFFKAVPSGATSTPWLTQNELQLILTLHDSAI